MQHQYDYSKIDDKHIQETFDLDKRESKSKMILEVIKDFSKNDLNSLKCLDLGCAAGFTVKVLSDSFKEVYGVDIDENAIEYAKKNIKKDNVNFVLAKEINYPFPDKSFDIIICNQIYEHVPDPNKLMSEINRLLKDDGFCYFGACNKYTLIEPHYNLPLLSYLPKTLANKYLKIFRKQDFYYENLYSFKKIKKLIKPYFSFTDYTLKVIKNPDKYNLSVKFNHPIVKKFPEVFFKAAYPIFPSYILLLTKKS